MTAELTKEPQVALSYFSLPTRAALLRQGQINEIAINAGYEGLELVPMNLTVSGIQMRFGLISNSDLSVIVSGHESPRHKISTVKTVVATLKGQVGTAINTAKWWAAFRASEGSLGEIARISDRVGGIQTTLYEGSQSNPHQDRFVRQLVQPHLGSIEYTGATNTDELIARLLALEGVDGFTCDIFHLRKANTFLAYDTRNTIDKLLPHTHEVHAAFFRVDSATTTKEAEMTRRELGDILTGQFKSEGAQMLKYIGQNWQQAEPPTVVVEVPAYAYGRVTTQEFIDLNHRFTDNIRQLMTPNQN